MKNIEAIKEILKHIDGCDGKVFLGDDEHEAFSLAIKVLEGPKPVPETGLVPCGCGGAVVMRSTMEYSDHCVECKKCDIGTPWHKTAKEARNVWNLSHGYKEDNDGF